MATIPESQNSIVELIDRYHESQAEAPRPHLGASMLGHPCDRWLWLSFRWTIAEKFPGRMLRLFRRGHLEEAQIVADLRAIGCKLHDTDENGKQMRVDFGSHVSGSMDGVIESGVPGATATPHIAEFKTHSDKSFAELKSKGVEKAKPMHWAQMQVYMHGTGLTRALYVAVNKNTDEYYTERLHYDAESAQRLVDRGRRITMSGRMPDPLSVDPTWYQCKFCPAHSFCHSGELPQPERVNCRNCCHSTPEADGEWTCARWGGHDIPLDAQRTGCPSHVIHPDLVPWTLIDSKDDWSAVYKIGECHAVNGEAGVPTAQLLVNPQAYADRELRELMDAFDATIIARES